MKYPRLRILLIFLSGVTVSCITNPADHQILIDTDLAFSEMSVVEGMPKAFIHFADTGVVILRNGSDPILGKNALIDAYQGMNDSNFTLKWEPEKAEIADSGDLGYTWGRYYLSSRDSLGNIARETGYYVSVWKKQSDGSWKYILDGGTTPVSDE